MNYPNKSKTTYNKYITYGNRGMNLEKLVNESNEYYLDHNIAIIYKKPTPIGIDKVEYKPNPVITKAFFKEASTLDYNGLYKGKYVDFDAKETKSKTSFPLHNIHDHQITHIKNIINHGGITFLLILINDEVYYLPGEVLINYIDGTDKASISYSYIVENGYLIKFGIKPVIDYIKIIDELYFKENLNE